MMVRENGRARGVSPSQSYAVRSTTTLFIAVLGSRSGLVPAIRSYPEGMATAKP